MLMKSDPPLKHRAKALQLHGILAHFNEVEQETWLSKIIQWEEDERQRRSLERRLGAARLGRFKFLADFDWNWPKHCDRQAIEELLQLEFLKSAQNPILIGPNGVGKTTIACNIAYQAVLKGHKVLFTTASQLLTDLSSQDGKLAFKRRLRHYEQPDLLVIDELGYLSYSDGHADLLFEIISRRHEKKSTLVTTNKPFIYLIYLFGRELLTGWYIIQKLFPLLPILSVSRNLRKPRSNDNRSARQN